LSLWFCLTTVFAVNPGGALDELLRFLKIQLFIFLTIALVSDKNKLDGFIWMMVVSIAYYGVKGGVFTLLTGGSYRVWGPAGSFIAGNNEVALAMLMTLPLMWYLRIQAQSKWVKHALLAAMLLTTVAVLGSQSRGAFIGIISIGLFFWLKARQKLMATIMVGAVAGVVLFFMPQSWWDRMETIKTYQQDSSALERLNAWQFALNVANDRLLGGGAKMSTHEMYARYAPDPNMVYDLHSIYFEQLGEQGWIGLGLFLLLALLTWLRCGTLSRIYSKDPDRKWASDLALMLQVSLIGYATGGAFLGLSYFDYYYDLVAAAVITWKLTAVATPDGPDSVSKAERHMS
jgi:probable O-glycosylation ligase (exosortase A-associated)